MKIYRPLWNEGVFLSPQQFQQQSLWQAYTNNRLAKLYTAHPWGVIEVDFDSDALALGRVHCQQLIVRLPDGTFIDTDLADDLPPPRDLSNYNTKDRNIIRIYIALPLLNTNGNNVQFLNNDPTTFFPNKNSSNSRTKNAESGATKSHKNTIDGIEDDLFGGEVRQKRYQQDWVEVQDLFSKDKETISVQRHVLSLRFEDEELANHIICPVSLIERDSQGVWRYSKTFIPPLMACSASKILCEQLSLLLIQLEAKRISLMNTRRESNKQMADFSVADVSLFWVLNALNSHHCKLNHFVLNPIVHPELIYLELVELAGALLTFSLTHDVNVIPSYQHQSLEKVFMSLFELIRELLDKSLPSSVITLDMQRISANQWRVPLHDQRLKGDVDFYLSVRSSLPAHQLLTQFPQLCKVGSPDQVNNLINVALVGIPLIALNQVPAAIPLRLDNHYFTLDLTHHSATEMLDSGCCAFYVPSTFDDIQLDLFAVLRTL